MEAEADALDEADGKPDYGRRMALRQEKAYPEIKKFETWMEVNILKCPPKSLMEEAISYAYKILKKLSLYVTDGRYKIDNNMVENSIRPLAVGRKNYLFCGDDEAAQRAAVVYSLLATCKAHGVNERAWLEDVLRRMPEYELGKKKTSAIYFQPTGPQPLSQSKPNRHRTQHQKNATDIPLVSVALHLCQYVWYKLLFASGTK